MFNFKNLLEITNKNVLILYQCKRRSKILLTDVICNITIIILLHLTLTIKH